MIGDWIAQLMPGLLVSLEVTIVSLVFGMPLGVVLGSVTEYGPRWLGWIVTVIVEIGRGLPALVVLYLIYFGLPSAGILLDGFWSVVLAFGYTTAAYTSEIFRGSLRGVARGQFEAAAAVGLPLFDRFVFVILPQALRLATPALVGFAVLVFQGSSLAYAVALPDLLSRAYNIGTITFQYLGVLSFAGAIYALITIGIGVLVGPLASRIGNSRAARAPRTTSLHRKEQHT